MFHSLRFVDALLCCGIAHLAYTYCTSITCAILFTLLTLRFLFVFVIRHFLMIFAGLVVVLCLLSSTFTSSAIAIAGSYSCCAYNSSIDLMKCVQESSREQLQRQLRSVPYLMNKLGPRLSVTVVTRATPNIYSYASRALFLQSIYAAKNGYALFISTDDVVEDDYELYPKLALLLKVMKNEGQHSDYIVWADADVIFLDLDLRIEQIAAQQPAAHIIISADVSSAANSGCFIVRNTPWAIRFLESWRKLHRNTGYTDQIGFEHVYHHLSDKDKSRVAIVPPHVLNSEAPPMGRQLPSHRVLHLAAESSAMREAAFTVAVEEVCDAHTMHRSVAPQLRLTRETLQQIAIQTYGAAVDTLEKQFQSFQLTPLTMKNDDILNQISALRYAVSKYVHAVEYAAGDTKSTETAYARRKVHETLSSPAQQAIDISRLSPALISTTLNVVKISCESSFEYMQDILYSHTMEWVTVGEYIDSMLTFLLKSTSKNQHYILLDMRAGLYSALGEGYLYNRIIPRAIEYFKQSLSATEAAGTLSKVPMSDKRSLFATRAMLAQCYCMSSDYDQGLKEYALVVEEESQHVGKLHFNLLQKYANYGVCAVEGGKKALAREIFGRAIAICDQSLDEYGDACRMARARLRVLEHEEL